MLSRGARAARPQDQAALAAVLRVAVPWAGHVHSGCRRCGPETRMHCTLSIRLSYVPFPSQTLKNHNLKAPPLGAATPGIP